jgi:putative Mn2+ efflux pump MntP
VKKPSLKVSGVSSWYKTQKQKRKEKEEQERNLEPSSLKLLAFVITLVAMAVGMSVLPLFPQPLPIFLAVLVAFITFKIPRVGMSIGGVVIGLGLMYHLAQLYFISFLGDIQIRVAFIVIWMALFIVPPAIFNRYKSALAIDFGILAVASLFVGPI